MLAPGLDGIIGSRSYPQDTEGEYPDAPGNTRNHTRSMGEGRGAQKQEESGQTTGQAQEHNAVRKDTTSRQ